MDASRLLPFSLTPSSTPSSAATSAPTAGGAATPGFAQWLAAWTPATQPLLAGGEAVPIGTGDGASRADPCPTICTDLSPLSLAATAGGTDPQVAATAAGDPVAVPACMPWGEAAQAGRDAAALREVRRLADAVIGPAGTAVMRPAADGPEAMAAVVRPTESTTEVGIDLDAVDESDASNEPAAGDEPLPVAAGQDGAAAPSWAWMPASVLVPVPVAVAAPPLTSESGGRGDAIAAREGAAPALSAALRCAAMLEREIDATAGGDRSEALATSGQDGATPVPLQSEFPVVAASALVAPPPLQAVPVPSERDIAVATPVSDPHFGDEVSMHLARHLSHMTGQSQEVVLHLHPAEMGPVSVGIELRGDVATVEFGAAQALTRQQLEQSLPALAQALRDEGLTLGQGSVHDRPASSGSGQRRRGETSFSPGPVGRAAARSVVGYGDESGEQIRVSGSRRGRIDLTA